MKQLSAHGAATPRVGEGNGGFPEPPAGAPVRVVSCSHVACGGETRIRLPWELPAEAVRSVVCASCSESFDCNATADLGVLGAPGTGRLARPSLGLRRVSLSMPHLALSLPRPAFAMPAMPAVSLPRFHIPTFRLPDSLYDLGPDPNSRAWRIGRVAIATVAVVGALMLIQGGSGETTSQTGPGATELTGEVAAPPVRKGGASTAAGAGEQGLAEPAAAARLVRQSSFSLALPAGWERLAPAGSATFTAASADGDADATLWVERDSKLDLAEFETRSLAQLEALAGSARVIDRVAAPTVEGTIITLAADAPSGGPRYEVVLRAAGEYRYYLATTLQADASREAIAGVELVQGSFTPEAGA